MNYRFERLPHPTVDWSKTEKATDGRTVVWIVCPWCNQGRFNDASETASRIRKGSFTGYCYKDRLLKKPRADRLERLPHPAVNWAETKIIVNERQRLTHVAITCPTCKVKRWCPPGWVAAKIRAHRFTGKCLECSGYLKRREWVKLGIGRKLDPSKGYIRLTRGGILPEDYHYFDAMKGARTCVLEHRLVMARVLGRPLQSNELVDHMDGVKTNNSPENLRLYIRGKNMPGEHSGYGTYYHEWQTALARIKVLEAENATLKQAQTKEEEAQGFPPQPSIN